MTDEQRPAHSPLGASGAERWTECPGSVRLLQFLELSQSDEEDWTREGTAGHEAAAHCLNTGTETWELVGMNFHDTVIDAEMASAIAIYVAECQQYRGEGWTNFVEYAISAPVHKDFYGTLDFGALAPHDSIVIRDLKMGKGVEVEPTDNPQMKYYAFGLIDGLERNHGVVWADETPVDLGIVQPRVDWLEPVRTWPTTVGEIKAWVHGELVPAMNATEIEDGLNAGPWCRFCPAKLVCPLLTSLFKAACLANPKDLAVASDQNISLSWQYAPAVKHYLTALEKEAFARKRAGRPIEAKLVWKQSWRVWSTDESRQLAQQRWGSEAMTPPEMKSPAEIDKLPGGKDFTKQHAHHPRTGLTLAPMSDKRPEVKTQTGAEAFGNVLDTEPQDA